MSHSDETRDPVEMLAEEFLARHRRGERPSITEYAEVHPEWSDRIRSLFPTLMMMEGLKSGTHSPSGSSRSGATEPEMPSQLGDFHIRREIGRGGMGVVYLAEQHSLGRLVALKVLAPEMMASPRTVERFRREAQAAARLHHTNIVPVFGTGEDQGRHFYVMQFIEGQSLDRVLGTLNPSVTVGQTGTLASGDAEREDPSSPFALCSAEQVALHLLHGRMGSSSTHFDTRAPATERTSDSTNGSAGEPQKPSTDSSQPGEGTTRNLRRRYWRNVAAVGMQAASAVHYAHHQGTLHRDIKPGNLMLGRTGTIWVTDFGLAKLAEQDDLTRPGDMIGTLRYMAPEQLEGISDRRTDIYSLGLTLYELLTLRPAFEASNRGKLLRQVSHDTPPRPRSLNREVPRDLETIVLKAIAHEPERRYQSAGELAEDLERFLDDRPIRARRASLVEHAWRWCRRNPALASVSALALVLMILVVCGGGIRYHQRKLALERETRLREKSDDNLRLAAKAFGAIFDQVGGPSASSAFQDTADGTLQRNGSAPSRISPQDAALLENILGFYDRFAEANQDNERWLYETAVARRRMGEIYQRLGRLEEAQTAYRRALEDYQRWKQTGVLPPELRVDAAFVHNELGELAGAMGRFSDSLKEHQEALEILETVSKDEAEAASYRFELARTYSFLARSYAMEDALGPGRPDASENRKRIAKLLDQAFELLATLSKENPHDGDTRLFMAECLHLLWMTNRLDQTDGAESPAQAAALRILEELARDFPDNPRYQSALAHAYMIACHSALSNPDQDTAAEQRGRLGRAVTIAEQLAAQYPDINEYKDLLARCYSTLADLLIDLDQWDEAEPYCRQALALMKEVRETNPSSTFYQIGYLRVRSILAGVLWLQGHAEEARELLEEVIQSPSTMPTELANSSITRRFLAEAYLQLAEVSKTLGDSAGSSQAAQKAQALITELPPIMLQHFRVDRWQKLAEGLASGKPH